MKCIKDHFIFRKDNQLKKIDKSFKGSWDEKIVKLCDKINSLENYYTTSSCSGRVVVLKNSEEKTGDVFLFVSHDLITLKELKKQIEKINIKDLIYFKQDPVILHVACRTLEDCQNLMGRAMKSGWKRNGIIGTGKRFVVELNATDKLELPIYLNRVLVGDECLRLIVSEANKKLRSSWEKIEKLYKFL